MIKKNLLFISFYLFVAKLTIAQTYSSGNINEAIPNTGVGQLFPLTVTNLPINSGADFGLESICIDITHPDAADIDIYLISPDGTSMGITTDNGKLSSNYSGTCFNMTSKIFINDLYAAFPPFTGEYRPESDLGAFNNGSNLNGIWQIYLTDDSPDLDSGKVNNWSLTFSNTPAQPFVSSDLPIMVIRTNGTYIEDEPKKMVDFGIIYNGPGQRNNIQDSWNHYNGKMGLEIRGSSSQQFPKKPYGFEIWDLAGDDVDTSILGLPSQHKFTLHAAYNDRSLMRNYITYKLFEKMGHYSIRTRYIEVVYNKSYLGVYLLTEKIGRGDEQVAISKLNESDVAGDDLTGGYIFSIDKKKVFPYLGWESEYASNNHDDKVLFQYYYPKANKILPVQKEYIKTYVDSFENALASTNFMDSISGYRNYIDVNSFIDNFIINEISKNIDAYRVSTYFHKNKNSHGGKIINGPVWDFDLAYCNANYGGGESTLGWQYQFGWEWAPSLDTTYPTPFWWRRFMEDSTFQNQLYCRYHKLRSTILHNDSINKIIDNTASLLNESQQRNFRYWPVMGKYTWPTPLPVSVSFQEETDKLKYWLSQRLTWIDQNLPGKCIQTGNNEYLLADSYLEVYPNPFDGNLNLRYMVSKIEDLEISVFSHSGSLIKHIPNRKINPGIYNEQIELNELSSGIYYIRFVSGKQLIYKKIVKI